VPVYANFSPAYVYEYDGVYAKIQAERMLKAINPDLAERSIARQAAARKIILRLVDSGV
jgi:hypothetical protein